MDNVHIIYTYNGILLGHEKEWNTDTCNKMNELWKLYTKWKRPDSKGDILYWLCLYEISRTGKSIGREQFPACQELGWGAMCVEFSFEMMKMVLKLIEVVIA